jgi:hypothetical protein
MCACVLCQDPNKELFLDMLTKDEKEALLTKKMESIRKQNEALLKRHKVRPSCCPCWQQTCAVFFFL